MQTNNIEERQNLITSHANQQYIIFCLAKKVPC